MFRYSYGLVTLVTLAPQISFAATTTGSLQSLLAGIGGFMNNVVIPFIIAIAFLIFVVNVVRFFIIGSTSTEGQKNAKNLALYGIGAFVFILTFWGFVQLLINGIGFNTYNPCTPASDYGPDSSGCDPSIANNITTDHPTRPATPVITDTPPALPSIDTSPSLPSSLPSNPSGNSNVGDTTPDTQPYTADYTTVLATETAIRTAAAPYIETAMPVAFYKNTTAVKAALLADLATTHNNTVTTLDRGKAMYRLVQLGVVPEAKLDDYLSAANTYEQELGFDQTPVTINDVSHNISVPLTVTVNQNIQTTKQAVQDELTAYNRRVSTEQVDIQQMIHQLFDVGTPDDRYAHFMSLYNGQVRYFLDNNGTLYQQFTANTNTENIFDGTFKIHN